jgi:hypothetical protein
MHKQIVVTRTAEREHLTDPWTRKLPEHKPIERSRERIDASFVLVGGWQVKYEPESAVGA